MQIAITNEPKVQNITSIFVNGLTNKEQEVVNEIDRLHADVTVLTETKKKKRTRKIVKLPSHVKCNG